MLEMMDLQIDHPLLPYPAMVEPNHTCGPIATSQGQSLPRWIMNIPDEPVAFFAR